MASETGNIINADELATDKVQQVEKLLDSNSADLDYNLWLSILKQIITAAGLMKDEQKEEDKSKTEVDESIYADYANDCERFNAVDLTEHFAVNSVKWTIRVKAFKLVHRMVNIMNDCRKLPVKHLPDLISLSFVASTSPYDDLKMQGFKMFRFLITRFATTEEKEFPGHSILEQYKTQILTALKPAFDSDAPPYITAVASHICSLWICNGLERDTASLARAFQMLMLSINKLEGQSTNRNSKLFTESELEQERLDIIGSWALVFVTASGNRRHGSKSQSELGYVDMDRLRDLMDPHVPLLVDKWWEALKDYALLIMPSPKRNCVIHNNGEVYTRDVALRLFETVWPQITLACTIWLTSDGFPAHVSKSIKRKSDNKDKCDPTDHEVSESQAKYISFLSGIFLRDFYRLTSSSAKFEDSTYHVIQSLEHILKNESARQAFLNNLQILREFHSVTNYILRNNKQIKPKHQAILTNLNFLMIECAAVQLSNNQEIFFHSIARLIESTAGDLSEVTSNNDLDALDKKFVFHLRCLLTIASIDLAKVFQDDCASAAFLSVIESIMELNFADSRALALQASLEILYKAISTNKDLCAQKLLEANICAIKKLHKSSSSDHTPSDANRISSRLEILYRHLRMCLVKLLSEPQAQDNYQILKSSIICIADYCHTTSEEDSCKLGAKLVETSRKYLNDLRALFSKQLDADTIKHIEQTICPKPNQVDEKQPETKLSKSKFQMESGRSKITLRADFSNFYSKKA